MLFPVHRNCTKLVATTLRERGRFCLTAGIRFVALAVLGLGGASCQQTFTKPVHPDADSPRDENGAFLGRNELLHPRHVNADRGYLLRKRHHRFLRLRHRRFKAYSFLYRCRKLDGQGGF